MVKLFTQIGFILNQSITLLILTKLIMLSIDFDQYKNGINNLRTLLSILVFYASIICQ